MKFEIKNRWSGVPFTAEIDCDDSAPRGVKIGLAVMWARKTRADLTRADLTGADLTRADLTGADLTDANLTRAVLTGADLAAADLTRADLARADLTDADLAGADLTEANLTRADLTRAVLAAAVLTGADLTSAVLAGAPVIPRIHQKVYAAARVPGALDMRSWHGDGTCGTTHCRAGLVVALAGDAGRELEAKIGTPAAATAIYLASDPSIRAFPDFYCDNASALDDMRARAEAEAERT